MTILITGGAGFIGSALIRHLIAETDYAVVNVDLLTYAANLDALESASQSRRYIFERTDIRDRQAVAHARQSISPTASFTSLRNYMPTGLLPAPSDFVATNIVGTFELVKAARAHYEHLDHPRRKALHFLHASTDESHGSLGDRRSFTENRAYFPNSPYATNNASPGLWSGLGTAPMACPPYSATHPITTALNNSRKSLFRHTALDALRGKPIKIYGSGCNIRHWAYVENHTRALVRVFEEGNAGERYNIGVHKESINLNLVRRVRSMLDELTPGPDIGSHERLIEFVDDRKGHDYRSLRDRCHKNAE